MINRPTLSHIWYASIFEWSWHIDRLIFLYPAIDSHVPI